MTRIAFPLFVLLVSMVACTTMPPPYDGPAPGGPMPGGMCDASAVSWAIGRAASPDVVEQARVQSRSAVVRVVEPGQMVTMDHRPDRLSIELNARGAIVGLKCG